jgi:hypothetical protein
MLWLLGCWQPPETLPPAPVQVEASDILEGSAGEIKPWAPTEDGEADPTAAEAGAEPEAEVVEAEGDPDPTAEAEAPEVEAPVVPVARTVDPWRGRTVGSPITIVDDLGAPVQVVRGAPVAVVVLMEGEDRLKVRCEGCLPVVEGWLQKTAVAR